MHTGFLIVVILWAALVGISVPLEVCNTAFLNKHSAQRNLHGLYVAQLAVAFGGLELLPISISSTPWGWPSKWWSLLGGACSVIAFVTVSAGPLLGEELLLMTQLMGSLGTFFVLDIADGNVRLTDWNKFLAFALTVTGVAIDNVSAFKSTHSVDGNWIVHLIGVFLSGVGFALQAKCNGVLGRDLGGPARAALVCAVVNIICSSPVMAYVAFSAKVPLVLDTTYWPLWLLAGFQSAFYIGSMAKLPQLLGFTTCYMVVLSAKLIFSSVIDVIGLGGKVVPFTALRAVSIVMVIVGATLFNTTDAHGERRRLLMQGSEEGKGLKD